jgi:hypothetical protein
VKTVGSRRRLLTAVIAVPLLVLALHVAVRLVGRQILIAQCERDKGAFQDLGLLGNSRCILNR